MPSDGMVMQRGRAGKEFNPVTTSYLCGEMAGCRECVSIFYIL